MTACLVWAKPLTAQAEREIRAAIKEREPKDCAFACINNDQELRLVFPVLTELTEALK